MLESALLILITFLAALVGTISGFGISSLMIPVVLLFYPLPTVLLFVGIIHLFGDVWKIIFFRRGADWKLIAAFGIPGVLLSYLGASIFLTVSPELLKRILGGFLILYTLYLFLKRHWRIPRKGATAVAGGALSGFFAGIFGIGGAVRGAFLAAYNLPKETYIFTAGLIALFIDVTRITRYLTGGAGLGGFPARLLIVLVPVSLLGAYLAKRAVDRVPQKYFRLVIAVFLGLLGLKFIIFP